MDLLSDILDTVALRGQIYFRTSFNPPWAVRVPSYGRSVRFHHVVSGLCAVRIEDDSVVMLEPGDLLLIPAGASHVLADMPDRPALELEQVLQNVGFTGSGVFQLNDGDAAASTQIVCGHFTFANGADHPLLRALPPYIHIKSAQLAACGWLEPALAMIAEQMEAQILGSDSAVRRISEVIFIEAIRAGIHTSEALRSLMSALSDPRLGRALHLMHVSPQTDWTVESLAQEAGMSRSSFAEHFLARVGQTPMAYLADWRLQRARALLQNSRRSVKEIAGAVGFASAAAFSRAFQARFSLSPRTFRQNNGG